jgi:type IV pilus assembly protein PilA
MMAGTLANLRSKLYLPLLIHIHKVAFGGGSSSKGFTLLELIAVLLVTAVLAALTLPTLISQVGKARETEAKSNLSAIGQAQQTYFFENSTFADNYDLLAVSVQSNYFTFPAPNLLNTNVAKHQADAINAVGNNTRNMSLGVYYANLTYSLILCRSLNPSTTTEAPDTQLGICSNSGIQEF